MSASQTMPMLSPDGQVGDVPQEKVPDAVKAGFTVGQDMLSPDGKAGVIPLDKVHDAIRSGFQIKGGAPKAPDPDMQKSNVGIAMESTPSGADPENATNIPEQQIQQMSPEDQATTRSSQLAGALTAASGGILGELSAPTTIKRMTGAGFLMKEIEEQGPSLLKQGASKVAELAAKHKVATGTIGLAVLKKLGISPKDLLNELF